MNSDRFKFRAWNKKTNTMIDLYKITPLATSGTLMYDGLFIPFCDELALMQSTGLKDSEGTLIYEGDILSYAKETILSSEDPLPNIRILKWDDYYGHLSHAYMDGNMHVSGHTFCKGNAEKFFKVIGNIYGSPELLKEGLNDNKNRNKI